eukprot:Lithocolla_globosa_v1_NODE_7232_length_974_cov_20.483134.p1 type:complete len:277 gc:universal NODE_7232_length_974_cov_20.483134:1-831(+)
MFNERKKMNNCEENQGEKVEKVMPTMIPAGWKRNQVFSEEEDPDRMKLPHQPLSFLSDVNVPSRQKDIVIEQIKLPWVKDQYTAFVAHNILNEQEVQELRNATIEKKYTPALLNIGMGMQQFAPEIRHGWRCMLDDKKFAKFLFDVLQPFVPNELPVRLKLSEINERCRFLYYEPGQYFAPHCDGMYPRPPKHPKFGDVSKLTIQLYLNDVKPSDGGATTFLDDMETKRVPCQPKAGSALIFSQRLFHEGSLLVSGEKYTMRTEFMYTRPGPKDIK